MNLNQNKEINLSQMQLGHGLVNHGKLLILLLKL